VLALVTTPGDSNSHVDKAQDACIWTNGDWGVTSDYGKSDKSF
jgi:hypothetical protein